SGQDNQQTKKQGGGTFGAGAHWGGGTPGGSRAPGGSVATMCTAKDGTYGKVTAKPYTGTDHPPTPPGPGEWYQTFCGGHPGWVWWRGPNAGPAANLQDLIDRLTPVAPDVSLSPTGDQLVNLRTFMWVDPVAVT